MAEPVSPVDSKDDDSSRVPPRNRLLSSVCKPWVLLVLLLAILATVVYRHRDTWVTLLTTGSLEPPVYVHPTGQPMGKPVGDVRDGFHPRVVIPREQHRFPPITEFPVAKAADVVGTKPEFRIRDNELVLGISVGDESRAYPINMLTGPQREIINDTVGGIPLAATW